MKPEKISGGDREDYEEISSEVSEIDNLSSLRVVEHLYDDRSIFLLETEVFENLIGYTAEDLLERADLFYDTSLSDYDVEDYEYGDGWALFRAEE